MLVVVSPLVTAWKLPIVQELENSSKTRKLEKLERDREKLELPWAPVGLSEELDSALLTIRG